MWLMLTMACTPDPEPVPTPPPTVAPRVVATSAARPVVPARPARDPVATAETVRPWGTEPPPCGGPCVPLEARLQASSEAKTDATVAAASLAGDGDPDTAWCGEGGVGQKLSLAFRGGPRTVRRVLLAGGAGEGAVITGLDLVTDRGDRVPVALEPPSSSWADAIQRPPSVDVVLPDVQFVQLEVTAMEGDGPACIAEVLVLGE